MAKKSRALDVDISIPKRPLSAVKSYLERLKGLPDVVYGQKRLEKLLVRRTKARFLPAGTHENAQKDPSGRPWVRLSRERVRAKDKKYGPGKPILVATNTLHDAIKIVRSNLHSKIALGSASGAKANIGVYAASPAAKYAGIHQTGGVSGRGSIIPQRKFLGIGKADVRAVDRLLKRMMKEQLG